MPDTESRKSILFDMDGTLIDPSEGIFDSLRYALDQLEVPQPPDEEFRTFVGPPLRLIFSRLLKTQDRQAIENAVALYRRRYASSGLYQCVVYKGIFAMLENLIAGGFALYVATIKPALYARKILDHTGLASSFRAIHGTELDGSTDDKNRLVREVIGEHGLNAAQSMMVGDRHMDIIAAKANGLVPIGVSYGFGSRNELVDAGVGHIADSPAEVVKIVASLSG